MKALFLTACVLVFSAQAAMACQVDEFYLVKKGALAAPSPEGLKKAAAYEKAGQTDRLEGLIKSGQAIRLKEDTKVRVLERSFGLMMIEVQLPGSKTPFWVNDGAVGPVDSPANPAPLSPPGRGL